MTERARRQYTREFKREAVELVTKQKYTVAQAAKSLDVNANVLGEVAAGVTEEGQRCLSGERTPGWRVRGVGSTPGREPQAEIGEGDTEEGCGFFRQGVRVRYVFVYRHCCEYPVRVTCNVLQVSHGGY